MHVRPGRIRFSLGVEVTATISLELQSAANGEFLEITGGDFVSISFDVFGLQAKLRGKLDCQTLQFTATTENGVWALGDPNLFPLGTFEATFEGMLDPTTGALAGDWAIGGDSIAGVVPGTCAGQWTTARSP